jgi:hypothetical protein
MSLDGGGSSSKETIWSGFPAAVGVPTAVTLKVSSKAALSGEAAASLLYSIDGGANWVSIYSTGTGFSQQTDSVVLLPAQNLTLVQVQASCTQDSETVPSTASHTIYEIWIEVVV